MQVVPTVCKGRSENVEVDGLAWSAGNRTVSVVRCCQVSPDRVLPRQCVGRGLEGILPPTARPLQMKHFRVRLKTQRYHVSKGDSSISAPGPNLGKLQHTLVLNGPLWEICMVNTFRCVQKIEPCVSHRDRVTSFCARYQPCVFPCHIINSY